MHKGFVTMSACWKGKHSEKHTLNIRNGRTNERLKDICAVFWIIFQYGIPVLFNDCFIALASRVRCVFVSWFSLIYLSVGYEILPRNLAICKMFQKLISVTCKTYVALLFSGKSCIDKNILYYKIN